MTEYEAWLVLNHRISRYDHADDINEALEAAKSALEKRVPKKPLFIKRSITQFYACPGCSTSKHYEKLFSKMKYCVNCGQALDWGENSKD